MHFLRVQEILKLFEYPGTLDEEIPAEIEAKYTYESLTLKVFSLARVNIGIVLV